MKALDFQPLTESTPNNVVKSLLSDDSFSYYISYLYKNTYDFLMENKFKSWEDGARFAKSESSMITRNAVMKLVASILKYTADSDELVYFHTHYTAGNFNFEAGVKRDGMEYEFNLETIIAGGYNIQCKHTRYICKGNLPKTKSDNAKRFTKLEDWKLTLLDENRTLGRIKEILAENTEKGDKRGIREYKKSLERQLVRIQKLEDKIANI